jgi:tyrosyl-tRNA synthetase
MHILDELQARGLVQDCTDRDGLKKRMDEGPLAFYTGFDPTGVSLHAGSLVGISVMVRLAQAGHRAIPLVGGSTGMVGDPSGKDSERSLLDHDTREKNLAAIKAQLARFFAPGTAIVNNHDWTRMGVMEFLRDVGKYITVNYMLAKESVRARLEDREQGISYTEFSYMLLQAWDFAHLAKAEGVELQTGGSDQWGNITTGIELARKLGHPKQLFGLVTPLLMTAAGKKFGKSESGTSLWLDATMTTPYQFYQYWINTADADVEKYLKFFTFLSLDEIAALMARHDGDRAQRLAQRELARLATEWVHGADAARDAVKASETIFSGLADVGGLSGNVLELVLAEVPTTRLPRSELEATPPLLDVLVNVKLADSKGAAKRLLQQGGVSVNGAKIADLARTLGVADVLANGLVVLRAGKKNFHLLRVA